MPLDGYYDDSEIDSDDDEPGEVLGNWLDDEDVVDNGEGKSAADHTQDEHSTQGQQHQAPMASQMQFISAPTHPLLLSRLDLYYSLCHVEDLDFAKRSPDKQVALMDTLELVTFSAGQNVFEYGDSSTDLYIIVSAEDCADSTRVAVIGRSTEGKERLLTYLYRGQYFGQMFFLTKQPRVRSATIRIPLLTDCEDLSPSVVLAKLTSQHFDEWQTFRKVLITKTVPLIQWLPKDRRTELLSQMETEHYNTNDYIIKQGEIGDKFFIVLSGSVRVVDEVSSRLLVTLREGHCFGELALVTNGLRIASVMANSTTTCLSMTKTVFQQALSADTFSNVVSELVKMHSTTRRTRQLAEVKMQTSSLSRTGSNSLQATTPSGTSERSKGAESVAAVITRTLSVRKINTEFGNKKIINDKYVILKEIGRGSYGEVFLCRELATDCHFALKAVSRSNTPALQGHDNISSSISSGVRRTSENYSSDDGVQVLSREIEVMKSLRHRNIVSLYEVIDDPLARKVYLIQEYMDGGVVMPDQELAQPLPLNFARRCFRDIVRGVAYLHGEGIIHRDIKPMNLMLHRDEKGTVLKICDFGAAIFMKNEAHGSSSYAGTPAFMAPELFLSKSDRDIEYSRMPSLDVFAMGATLYYMVRGHPPWMANNQLDLAAKIRGLEPTLPTGIEPHLRYLLLRMLDKDYAGRITVPELIEDAWVTQEGSEPLLLGEPEAEDTDTEDYFRFLNTTPTPLYPESLSLLLPESPPITIQRETSSEAFFTAPDSPSLGSTEDWKLDAVDEVQSTRTLYRTREFYLNSLSSPGLGDYYDAGIRRSSSPLGTHETRKLVRTASGSVQQFGISNTANVLTTLGTGSELQEVQLRQHRRERALLESRMWARLSSGPEHSHSESATSRPRTNSRKSEASVSFSVGCAFNSTSISGLCPEGHQTYKSSSEKLAYYSPSPKPSVEDESSGSDSSDDVDCTEKLLDDDEFESLMDSLSTRKDKDSKTTALWNCIIAPNTGVHVHRSSLRSTTPKGSGLSTNEGEKDILGSSFASTGCRTSFEGQPGSSILSRLLATKEATNLDLGIRYGIADSIGSRMYMEDRSLCCAAIDLAHVTPPMRKTVALFGVFDGHSGSATAEALQVELPELVASRVGRMSAMPNSLEYDAQLDALKQVTERQMVGICADLDRQMLIRDYGTIRNKPKQLRQAQATELSGATAAIVVAFALESSVDRGDGISLTSKHVLIANVGDCRVVLSVLGVAHVLTSDHKPNSPREKLRIELAGGTVSNGRVGGVLGVSRCFGDWQYKLFIDEACPSSDRSITQVEDDNLEDCLAKEECDDGLWSPRRQVVSRPDTLSFDVTVVDEFLLVATDGLWDVFGSQEAINFVRWQIHEHGDIARAASQLIQEAVSRAPSDNVTVLIVGLNQQEHQQELQRA